MRSRSITVLLLLAACGSFRPDPLQEVPFRKRVQTEEQDDLLISVTVLDDDEAERVYGRDVASMGMQPVWIEVENRTDVDRLVLPIALDPDYVPPYEAAYRNRITWGGSKNERIIEHFITLNLAPHVGAGKTNRGFILTGLDRGAKSVTIECAALTRSEDLLPQHALPKIFRRRLGANIEA